MAMSFPVNSVDGEIRELLTSLRDQFDDEDVRLGSRGDCLLRAPHERKPNPSSVPPCPAYHGGMVRFAICLFLGSAAGCSAPSSAPSPATAPPPPPSAGAAPAETTSLTSVIGVWRGTSLCTVRPSPCND